MNDDAQAAWQLARIKEDAARGATLTGPQLVSMAATRCGTQAILTSLTGISAADLASINRGRRPTKTERAAILWAIIQSQL